MTQDMFQSTSDERVTNNVMRHEYRVLTDEEKMRMKDIKDDGLRFIQYLDKLGTSRELSLAKTKIEEAVMWAVRQLPNKVNHATQEGQLQAGHLGKHQDRDGARQATETGGGDSDADGGEAQAER